MATQNPVGRKTSIAQLKWIILCSNYRYTVGGGTNVVRSNLNNVQDKIKSVVTTKQIEVAQATVREIYMDEKIEIHS